MKVDLYSQQGEKKGTLDLPKEMFEVPFNKDLVHQTLVRQLSNSRIAIAHTQTKGEVHGGGRKPWRQKGTGRARQGSSRNPHWKGGGVAFGPRNNRNFTLLMPKTQRRKAMFVALSDKARSSEIIGLENFTTTEKPKTKPFAEMIKKLPIKRSALVVIPEKNPLLQKSASNISNVKVIQAGYLNIQDLQRYNSIVILKDSVAKLKEIFLKTA